MLSPAGPWWMDVLEEHLEELESLWGRRAEALRSANWKGPALAKLDERVEAHADALELAGATALPVLEPALAQGGESAAAAAAYALARAGSAPLLDLELKAAFVAAAGPTLAGIGGGLCLAPRGNCEGWLGELAAAAEDPQACFALRALAFRAVPARTDRLAALLRSSRPELRRAAWETLGYLGPRLDARTCGLGLSLMPHLQAGIVDPDAGVRRAALHAGALTRQGGLLEELRRRAASPRVEDLDALLLLAVLARAEDAALVRRAASEGSLGPARCRLLAALGDGASVTDLLDLMRDPDPVTSAAAALGFRKVTGVDVGSGVRVPGLAANEIVPAGGDAEAEAALADEVELPDAERAAEIWSFELERKLTPGTRYAQGLDVEEWLREDLSAELDRESLWQMWIRAIYRGRWQAGAAQFEAFFHPRSQDAPAP